MGCVMDEVLCPSWARSCGHWCFHRHWAALGKGWTPEAALPSRSVLGLCSIAELSWAAAAAAGALEQTLRVLKGFERSYNLKKLS